MGRPNTGKSSMVNRLLGSERMIVSDIPGTTRDAIDSVIQYEGKSLCLHRHRRPKEKEQDHPQG